MEIKKQENLKKWSWWRVGGNADYFCQPANKEELKEALLWAEKQSLSVTALGSGTNVLISDAGVEGLVISMEKLSRLDFHLEGKTLKIKAEAGVLKSRLMMVFQKYTLAPALFLSGLPGDIGGGLVMNAGISADIYPKEFSQIVHDFEVMNAQEFKLYNQKDIAWGYRYTSGWEKGLIYRVSFQWPLEPIKDLNTKIKDLLKKRRKSQPLGEASCGSVFKNPHPQFAGKLIEDSGLKGLRKGDAFISKKHGNFIINAGQARATDIDSLIKTVQKTVKEKFGIFLKKEVHYLGRWTDIDSV